MKTITVGRELDNDIVLNDIKISRHHLKITIDENMVRIEDLGSRNGTFINGQRLSGATYLKAGDKVDLGGTPLPWQSYIIDPAHAPTQLQPELKPANNQQDQPVEKQRHGCLSSFLVLMMIANAGFAILIANLSDIDDDLKLYSIVGNVLVIICAILIWNWKKIGFWGIVVLSGISAIINLSMGLVLPALQNFLPIFFLWAALSKPKNGVTGWQNLE